MMKKHIVETMPIWNPREIEFGSQSKAKGIDILLSTGDPVRVVGENRFVVSDTQCKLLRQKRVNYTQLRVLNKRGR